LQVPLVFFLPRADGGIGPLQTPDATIGPLQTPDATIGPPQTPDAAIGPLQTPDATIGPLQAPDAGTGHMTEFSILLSPQRAIDILFTIDNSPSMDTKQKALANNFPKMITALMALPGGLPDVHIGVISSNMGAGSGAMGGGNCGNGLGDRGLLWGNDSNDPVASVADNGNYFVNADPYNTPPALIASGCGLYPGARWIEDIQAPGPGTGRQRNYSTNLQLEDVFSCLAKAVGISGCGEEHQLQATRVALIPQSGINDANNGFLRSNAYLAIVLVTDEDDCSATPDNATNDNIFDMVGKRNPGDTTSVRCAARGHLCGGQPIPNYDPAVGYMGTGFTHDLSDCTAKAQKIPPDYVYMPLMPEDLCLVPGGHRGPAGHDAGVAVLDLRGRRATVPCSIALVPLLRPQPRGLRAGIHGPEDLCLAPDGHRGAAGHDAGVAVPNLRPDGCDLSPPWAWASTRSGVTPRSQATPTRASSGRFQPLILTMPPLISVMVLPDRIAFFPASFAPAAASSSSDLAPVALTDFGP
jgi:hypothetical protein